MEQNAAQVEMDTMPWLLFRIKGQTLAVNAGKVNTVFLSDRTITQLPDSPEFLRGILDVRGAMIPMIDLRQVMGYTSVEQEYQGFVEMLEQRKGDHVHWVEELDRCMAEGQNFGLATDPHQCAFGKWYDSYQTESNNVRFHLRKIDEPHQLLHHIAVKAIACQRLCDDCKRETCLKEEVKLAREQYMPQVVELLEEAKSVFRNSFREMCLIITEGEDSVGLLVDEVVGMETIGEIKGVDQLGHSGILAGVASWEDMQVLILDCAGLLHTITGSL